MTERGGAAASADTLAIGPSVLRWDGTALRIAIDERSVPRLSRLRGTVTAWPEALTARAFRIDRAGQHIWAPIAPSCRVAVDLPSPGLCWSGRGYLDHNGGDAPLERDFAGWHWSRAAIGDGTIIFYDTEAMAGDMSLSLHVRHDGRIIPLETPPLARLNSGFWGVRRVIRSEGAATVRETLTDAPFYARSVVATRLLGREATALHESLSLRRFRNPLVQAMLMFRMPRERRGGFASDGETH